MVIGFAAGAAQADPFQAPTFDADNFPEFPNINNIDNPFMTLEPGTAFCYEAETEDGIEKNEVTVVTDDSGACTLKIAGVTVIVVRDVVRLEDEQGDLTLTEDTFDLFAQDNAGNVWYLGEASAECKDGGVDNTEGTWNADMPGAKPGIVMLAEPLLMPGNSYQQEFLADVAEDMAKIQRLNAKVSVPYDSDVCTNEGNDCLKTKEWTPLERGAIEFKYYDPIIGGLVLTEELQGGKTVRSELVDVLLDLNDTGACPTDFANALAKLCTSPPPMNCPDNPDNDE